MSNLYLGLLQQFTRKTNLVKALDLSTFCHEAVFPDSNDGNLFASGILQADPKLEKFAQNWVKCHGLKTKGELRLDRPLGEMFSDRSY